ncbi:hypothetical protein K458DRAFT_337817 [Lentithecium fluviatile CBS 122367]|uniref:Zn(2)-C6 fungal-type domain-containing protein n=1 Tax=Lentithecium fluviatile CBS 122367 TaxID=1168545 RepID=A0A6G1J3G1_9PLEO|nr:hypothetical protein K458DRAFT_337817 [Lentithecium fluviatile CBS 122367]
MASPAPKRVSKACDACKLRKVKCNGQERCQQCSHLGLRCVYSVSVKTRSQGKRGRIITEYKNKTSNATAISPSILPAGSESPGQPSPPLGIMQYPVDPLELTSPISVGPQYGQTFFLDLLPDYVEGVYPVQPVIAEQELREYISVMDTDPDVRSFVFAFGACTLNLTRYGDQRTEEVQRTIESLMDYSITSMKPPYKSFHSSVMRVMQSIFIHNCLMSIQASDAAFHYMRDAITAVQLLRVDNPEIMAPLPPPERSRRQRMYWQAFIHERFVAILDYRRAILPPLESMPEDDPTIPIQVHEGFSQIIKLFKLLDQDFLKNWLDSQGGNVTSSWIEAKSRELEGDEEANAEELARLSTMQRADLAITREWLRTLVWRLAMSQTLLSSRSSKECLSLLFPVRLSQNLRHQVSQMSRHDIEVHGSSMTQKLFEITDTIADVLIHVPAGTLEETAYRIEDYLFILDFVLLFPTLDQTRRGILLEKLERLQSMFPEVCSATSSPNMPLEMQSPSTAGTDPWCQVAHSKIGGEASTSVSAEALALVGLAQAPYPEQERSQRRDNRQAKWNHISRRLSMATFTVPGELAYNT